MRKIDYRQGRYFYSIFSNSAHRALSFQYFADFFETLPKGECALDYGAGDRPLEDMIKSRYDRYLAADYQPANDAHSVRPDIYIEDDRLDVESGSMDCVVLTEVMEHLYEPKSALKEIKRVLKPGGMLIGTVPFAIGEHEQPYDFHRYTYFCLKRMFEETGYNIVKLEYVGDGIGVATSSFCKVFAVIPKALHKFKLPRLAYAAQLVLRIPEIVYFGALRIGLDPARVAYFRSFPLGFAFLIEKPRE